MFRSTFKCCIYGSRIAEARLFSVASYNFHRSPGTGNRFEEKFRNQGKYKQKRLVLNIDKYTPKAKLAVQSIVNKVSSSNPSFKVKIVNKGKLVNQNLIEIINGLDQAKEGIQVIPNNNNEHIVRKISVIDMIKEYSDELAKAVEENLVESGSKAALRAKEQRERADKKKSAVKSISLKWSINIADLKLQKSLDIRKRIDKGEKFQIVMEGKKIYASRNDDEELANQFELKRRNHVVDELINILEESETGIESSGTVEGQLILNCTPKEPVKEKKVVKTDKKDKKVKKQKAPQTKKIEEEDLDALYLFKIED